MGNNHSKNSFNSSEEKTFFQSFCLTFQTIFESSLFNITLALLIITSVSLIFVEFLLEQGPQLQKVIFFNNLITLIFSIELTIRAIIAPNKRIFLSNFWIDILSVVPEFRIFRTFRIFRLLRLLRFTRAAIILVRQSGWFSAKFAADLANFSLLIVATILIVLCGTLALEVFEVHHTATIPVETFLERIWETAFLFTSGEMLAGLPHTLGGRIVALLISIAGLVMFAVLVGVVTASFSTYLRTTMEAKEIALNDLDNHIVICGWERISKIILQELESHKEIWRRGVVIIAETDIDIAQEVRLKYTGTFFHINGDFTSVENLEAAGIKRAKTAIVLADKGKAKALRDQDRDARTVLVCLTVEKLNPGIFTIAELLNDENAEHLRMAGVEEILSRTGVTGGLMAASAINHGVTTIVEDIINHSHNTEIKSSPLPPQFVGKTILDLVVFLKTEQNATLLSIEKMTLSGKTEHIVNPQANIVLMESDRITVIAKKI